MSKPFAPMLGCRDSAHTFSDSVKLPVFVSPKLDGIRNVQAGSKGMSRKLLDIPNRLMRACLANPELDGLDGEIIVGPPNAENVYNRTSSAYMAHNTRTPFDLYVFDDFTCADASYTARRDVFLQRAHDLQALTGKISQENDIEFRIYPVHSVWCETWEEVEAQERKYLEFGFEGAILRHPDMPYKYGRSTAREQGMLKLKRFVDGEAVIIGFEELMHNTNEQLRDELGNAKRSTMAEGMVAGNTLGAFIVRDVETSVEFNIGMFKGLTAEDKQAIWNDRGKYEGKMVKYSHFPVGAVEKPRHPKFIGFRAKSD